MSTICVVVRRSECSLQHRSWPMWRRGVSSDEYVISLRGFTPGFRGFPARCEPCEERMKCLISTAVRVRRSRLISGSVTFLNLTYHYQPSARWASPDELPCYHSEGSQCQSY